MNYDPNAPAFPSETNTHFHLGLNVREYFIGQALQGCACDNRISPEEQALRAVRTVDKVFRLLNEPEELPDNSKAELERLQNELRQEREEFNKLRAHHNSECTCNEIY